MSQSFNEFREQAMKAQYDAREACYLRRLKIVWVVALTLWGLIGIISRLSNLYDVVVGLTA